MNLWNLINNKINKKQNNRYGKNIQNNQVGT